MSVLNITKDNFKKEVLEGKKKVLIDFWAAWCGPCKIVSPLVAEIATERNDVIVGKINIDENQDLASEFGVMSIPTFLVFENGLVVNKAIGAISKEEIENLLK